MILLFDYYQFYFVSTDHYSLPSTEIYGLTKHYCDQKYGLMTQCLKAEYFADLPNGYFENFLLKVIFV